MTSLAQYLTEQENHQRDYKEAWQSAYEDPEFLCGQLKDYADSTVFADIQAALQKADPDLLLVGSLMAKFLEGKRNEYAHHRANQGE